MASRDADVEAAADDPLSWGSLTSEAVATRDYDDEISGADAAVLQRFEEKTKVIKAKADRFNKSYRNTLLHCLHQFAAEVGGLATTLEDSAEGRRAVNDMVIWLDEQDLSPYTQESGLSSLRVFGHLMLEYTSDAEFDEDELPARFADLDPGQYTRDLDPTPLPTEIVSYQDAVQMAEAQDQTRDAALIMVQWAAGLRPMCELHRLKYKHVKDEGNRYVITVPKDAKTGARTVYVYTGAPLLRKWLEQEHPAHLEPEPDMRPETPIWTHHDQNKPIVYGTLASVFERAADRADVRKPNSPQNFRRSCASYCAAQTATDERTLRERFGWSEFSSAPDHYIAQFAEGRALKVAKAYGHEIEDHDDQEDSPSAVRCDGCERWTTRGFDHCIWCSHPVGEEVQTLTESIQHPEAGDKDLLDMILDDEIGPEELEAAQKLEGVIKTRQDFWADLDELIALAEHNSDDSASAFLGPAGLVGWLPVRAHRFIMRMARVQDQILRLDPGTENYPPDRRTSLGLIVFNMFVIACGAAVLGRRFWSALLAGHPPAVVTVTVSLLLSPLLWWYIFPGVDDLEAALREAEGS